MDSHKISFSASATARWKRGKLNESRVKFSQANHRRLTSLVKTQKASLFLNLKNQIDETQKVTSQEDKREVSLQLGVLKSRHDRTRTMNTSREQVIQKLQSARSYIQKMGSNTGAKFEQLKETASGKECRLEMLLREKEDAELTSKVYEHMIERMQMEKIDLDRRTYLMEKQIKEMNLVLREELDKQRRKREDKIHTKEALDYLEHFISNEKKDALEKLEAIEKDVAKKTENSVKRKERMKRQLDIAEEAANEEKNKKNLEKKESLLIHRLWYKYLNRKLSLLMKKYSNVEEAFEKVRKIGELDDINQMVHKIMTREQEYNELVKNVLLAKEKVDSFIKKNSETEYKILQLELPKSENQEYIQEKNIEFEQLTQAISSDKEKLIRLSALIQKIKEWNSRTISRIQKVSNTQISISEHTKLTDLCSIVKNFVLETAKTVRN